MIKGAWSIAPLFINDPKDVEVAAPVGWICSMTEGVVL